MLDKLVIIIFYLANFKYNVVYHIDSFDVSWASGRTIYVNPNVEITNCPRHRIINTSVFQDIASRKKMPLPFEAKF